MNENIFNGIADIYDKYRPSYPHALFTYLCSEAGMNASTVVADIGSGTGILSKELLDICNLVYAVEPNNDMRKIAEYYGAAEPPVRCGESHLSGLTEPLRSL